MKRFFSWFKEWWNAPPIFDQFESIFDSNEDVLELTEVYGQDPFGRFKRKIDAASR